ncbi:hypothetical protein G1H11_11170 [Phytoactinopolyspora alkaliphila]|uniref:Uncharacterized protein n=1 Tax=Phytoactinopolyspora alkaliphila TaxID=1783498 RepID=A0A6N9YLP0_9ACTN|nr:hypothetical protein [Phytoactinopolyspora alkaliphila]NED95872.1 hypothetical protein [Phytoactinopolyspora alkaliphila]
MRPLVTAAPWCALVSGYLAGLLYVYQVFVVLMVGNEPHYQCSEERFGIFEPQRAPAMTGLESGYFHPKALCQWADGVVVSMIPRGVEHAYDVLFVVTCVSVAVALAGGVVRLRRRRHASKSR